jgi:hypothetical protein
MPISSGEGADGNGQSDEKENDWDILGGQAFVFLLFEH